ncbi:hypothetical protein DPMN_182532 [Dreissena polymorpha]|uniref:Uncharacterized protein n=1 Tax=Dreissena polymorpha TaxID=45954 RepID=A0A9D4DGF9_DREPO|nr:hypothetical protein DPMN_182532 [Dreissena polymorpha]
MGLRRPPAPPPESADSQQITISAKSVLATSSISNSKSPNEPGSSPTTRAQSEMNPLPEIEAPGWISS